MSMPPLGAHRGEAIFGKPLPSGTVTPKVACGRPCGHIIESEASLENLLDRGAGVDRSGHDAQAKMAEARPEEPRCLRDSRVDHTTNARAVAH